MPRDMSFCRTHFPSLDRRIGGQPVVYLDGPGGSQVPADVQAAIVRYYLESNSNTGGPFAASQETDALIARTRAATLAFLGGEGRGTVSFGQNTTTLAFALARAVARTIRPGDEVVVTELDHEANVSPWLTLAEAGAVIRWARLRPEDGTLDMAGLLSLIGPRTRVVAVGIASNALGTVTDVAPVRAATAAVGALLVVDAVHYAPHLPLDVAALDPDFLFVSAYKFFGPHLGVLYARHGALDALPTDRVRPQVPRAPERIETGTLNHAALAGLEAAIHFIAALAERPGTLRERLVAAMTDIYAYEHALAGALAAELAALPGVRLYGPPFDERPRTPTLSFTVEGRTSEEVAAALGRAGIYAWWGDFYAVGVVDRLGLRERGGLVRIGLAPYNTEDEGERFLAAVRAVLPGRWV